MSVSCFEGMETSLIFFRWQFECTEIRQQDPEAHWNTPPSAHVSAWPCCKDTIPGSYKCYNFCTHYIIIIIIYLSDPFYFFYMLFLKHKKSTRVLLIRLAFNENDRSLTHISLWIWSDRAQGYMLHIYRSLVCHQKVCFVHQQQYIFLIIILIWSTVREGIKGCPDSPVLLWAILIQAIYTW